MKYLIELRIGRAAKCCRLYPIDSRGKIQANGLEFRALHIAYGKYTNDNTAFIWDTER